MTAHVIRPNVGRAAPSESRDGRRLTALLRTAALFSAVLASPTVASPATEARVARIERGLLPAVVVAGEASTMTLADRLRRHRVPGVSVAVIDRGRLAWARGWGEARTGVPVRPDTLFQAASVSKPVAAMATLRLAQDGKLDLDAPVARYLAGWRLPSTPLISASPVTLRRVLSHSAGLTVHGFDGYPADAALPSLRHILDGAPPANSAAVRVDRRLGQGWRYSGGGYVLLQQIVEVTTRRPFGNWAANTVLRPLGMTRSAFAQPPPAEIARRAAVAHDAEARPIAGRWHVYPELAAAGLWTTPSDLARFMRALMPGAQRRVLNARWTAAMLSPQPGLATGGGGMGLGLFVAGNGEAKRFFHSGVNEGYRIYLVGFFETGQGAVLMTNGEGGMPLIQELLRAIAAEYCWPHSFSRTVTPVAVAPAELEPFAGSYRLAPGLAGEARVSADNGRLLVALAGGTPAALLPLGEDRFVRADDGTDFRFVRNAVGAVIAVEATTAAGQMLRAARTDGP